jgi:Type II secretion system (T2SS), protein E, N-terminal domain
VPLGLLMLSRADVTATQLRHALDQQMRDAGMRIGECMQRLGFVNQQQVTAALAAQWRCPVLHTIPQQVLHYGLPHGLLVQFQMLPVHFASATRTLHIAFASEIAYRALVAAEQMLDCKTEACLTTPAMLRAGFERMQQNAVAPEKQFADARSPAEMARISSSYAARLDAENVKLAACGELAWVRIESGNDFMNLLFQRPG